MRAHLLVEDPIAQRLGGIDVGGGAAKANLQAARPQTSGNVFGRFGISDHEPASAWARSRPSPMVRDSHTSQFAT